jgi:hypothetical protein
MVVESDGALHHTFSLVALADAASITEQLQKKQPTRRFCFGRNL